jgi:phage shock protein A
MEDDMAKDDSTYKNLVDRLNSESEGKMDTDLSGMDNAAAYEYVLAFAQTFKETQKARSDTEKEKALWDERVSLAKSKNNESLAAQAAAKAESLNQKLAQLQQEETELRRKVSFMKDELKRLKAKTQLSVEPEALLAQFEMVLGAPDTTAKNIKDTEAALELEKLKNKMKEEGK